MKTIYHITGMNSSKYGGLEKYFIEIAKQCSFENIRLVLFYKSIPSSQKFLYELNKYDVEIYILPSNRFFVQYLFKYIILLLRHNPHVVHGHFSNSYPYLIISSFFFKKIFITNHSMMTDDMGIPFTKKYPPLKKSRFIRRITFKVTNKIFSVSKAIEKQLLDLFELENKISTHYIGVKSNPGNDLKKNKKVENPKKIIITNIAWHSKVKGVDILLKATKILLDKGIQNFIVYQIGDNGTETKELYNFWKENNLESIFRWVGTTDKVNEYLMKSDIYCQPSRSEGLGLSILEAMSCSLPVVATSVGGIPEIIIPSHNGYLVNLESAAEEIARCFEIMIYDKKNREELGINGKIFFEQNFSLEYQVKKQMEFYL